MFIGTLSTPHDYRFNYHYPSLKTRRTGTKLEGKSITTKENSSQDRNKVGTYNKSYSKMFFEVEENK